MSRRSGREPAAGLRNLASFGYVGDRRTESLLIAASLGAGLSVFAALAAMLNYLPWLAAGLGALAALSFVAMVKLSAKQAAAELVWIKATYDLYLSPVELQRLKEGKPVRRGDVLWLRDEAAATVGLKLQQTRVISAGS